MEMYESYNLHIWAIFREHILSPCECIGEMKHFLFVGFLEKKNGWKVRMILHIISVEF